MNVGKRTTLDLAGDCLNAQTIRLIRDLFAKSPLANADIISVARLGLERHPERFSLIPLSLPDFGSPFSSIDVEGRFDFGRHVLQFRGDLDISSGCRYGNGIIISIS